MSRGTRQGSSVRTRILLLAILPVMVVSALLSGFFIADRQRDFSASLEQYGSTVALGVGATSVLAVYADDRERLAEIARAAMLSPLVREVAFFNRAGQLILARGEPVASSPMPPVDADSQWPDGQIRGEVAWYFRMPIRQDVDSIADYEDAVSEASPLLGWAVVVISQEEMLESNRQNILLGLFVSLGTALLASLVAFWMSHRIYQPIRDLTATVQTMEGGNLDELASVAGDREVRILARVINRMATNLRETNQRLRREVEAATADLEHRNADLEVTRDELEKAMGARDQFLARMSHELRTPLATIIGFTRRLQHTSLDHEQEEYRHAIQHASDILISVIDDIIEFARMEHGGIELESIEFNLESELEDLVAMHALAAHEKSMEMVLLLEADVPRLCQGDPARLRQVVSNLLANAVKFSDAGEVVLRVSRNDSEAVSGRFELQVEVRDSGIGISAEDLQKLFQPFSQADTTISRRFGGSGLGLVICQQLIELMGGQINIESEPGEGTTVRFSVQLQQTEKEGDWTEIPRRKDVVAVLDLNPWSRRALRTQLTYWSRQVFAFAQVADFIAQLEAGERDFTVLLVNPGSCSPEAQNKMLEAIRKYYRGPIVLLLSPGDSTPGELDALPGEFAPLWSLGKPVRREKLVALLDVITREGVDPEAGSEVSSPVGIAAGDERARCLQSVDILVVEDNQYNRNLIQALLEAAGARVQLAEDGAQAVKQFASSPCSLVLMDAHMPGVDGIQACRDIVAMAEEGGRQVRVIGLTADLLESEKQRFLDAGAADVLYKPFDERELLVALAEHAGGVYTENCVSIADATATSKLELQGEMAALVAKLRESLQEARIGESRELVHQLQGLTGLYGLDEIRQCIVELSDGLASQQPDLEGRLRALEEQIDNMGNGAEQ